MPFPPLAQRLGVGLATLLVWALAAGSVVFWLLHAGVGGASAPARVATDSALPAIDERAVARALGAERAPQAKDAQDGMTQRLALRGVLTHGAGGAALIAIDGQPARTVRVGALLEGLDGGWTLRSVAPHAAVLAAGARELTLEMPPPDQRPAASASLAAAPHVAPPAIMHPVTAGLPPAPAGLPFNRPPPAREALRRERPSQRR